MRQPCVVEVSPHRRGQPDWARRRKAATSVRDGVPDMQMTSAPGAAAAAAPSTDGFSVTKATVPSPAGHSQFASAAWRDGHWTPQGTAQPRGTRLTVVNPPTMSS